MTLADKADETKEAEFAAAKLHVDELRSQIEHHDYRYHAERP